MDNPNLPRKENTPLEVADQVASSFFGIKDQAARQRAIRQFLLGTIEVGILIPLLFYLRFREIGPLGWGTTIFFIVYFLLCAAGLYFRPRTEYHSPVILRGDWL